MPTYREATDSDLPSMCTLGEEVNALHHETFPHVFAGPGTPDRDQAHWKQSIGQASSTTFVAEDGGQVVAFVTVAVITENHPLLKPLRYGRVGSVAVTASRRGKGIGPEIMRLAEEWVRTNGGQELRLNVWAFNDHAMHMYRELGYEVRSHSLAKQLAQSDA